MSWLTKALNNSDLIQNLKNYQLIKSDLVYKCMSKVDRGFFCNTNPYFDQPQSIGYNATM